ncbi:MAG: CHC2 zinc finger domain-containing protein, partial [Bacilli bacterium]
MSVGIQCHCGRGGSRPVNMRIPEEFLALLRQKIDIVDIVSEHVRLKRAGRSLVGLCPFHSDRTPSF